MTHGSLFSGIGGFDLAAEWMGWDNVFHCEWNPFGQRVLHHYWPDAIQYTDITKTNFKIHANTIDILTGGFPCQPYSSAGKRKGKEDERHLWPQMCRAISEIAPRFVVGENVRGLTNWNGGVVFDEVCTDLENLGYQVAPFIIPACAVNAPHQRERVWFVAYTNSRGLERTKEGRWNGINVKRKSEFRNATNTDNVRLQQRENGGKMERGQTKICGQGNQSTNATQTNGTISNATNNSSVGLCCNGSKKQSQFATLGTRQRMGEKQGTTTNIYGASTKYAIQAGRNVFTSENDKSNWEFFPTQPPICGGNDGIPSELDGITFSKWRKESIMAYGNAIVPQVAYQIFKAIQAYDGHD